MSLKHWQQMGGVNINKDIVIDKSVHRTINSQWAALKVELFNYVLLLLADSFRLYVR